MKGILSESQLKHVLVHLNHHLGDGGSLTSLIRYRDIRDGDSPGIYIPPSRDALDLNRVVRPDGIPVLYPGTGPAQDFYSFQGPHLVFHHDLLKSAFHLLSGYQEIDNPERDEYERFPYRESIQHALGIIGRPVVNEYFRVILEGMKEFAGKNSLPFAPDPVLKGPVLMLSHDIDLIDGYSFYKTGFRFKQLLGLAPSPYNRSGRWKEAFTSLVHWLNPFSRKDPFWTFETMHRWEHERQIHSTYFFLEKEENRSLNSAYRFHEKRFMNLFRELSARGHEVAIHGTMRSARDQGSMDRTVNHLRRASPDPVQGIRQHFLKYLPGKTPLLQEKAGLLYDATLGFSEHEGFRNSYCWPFRLYDFDRDRSMELWEVPLTCMDVTLFTNRRLELEGSRRSVEELVAEVRKFNGVFSMLWHNHFFDEREFPGIINHYTGLLDHCRSQQLEGLTGREIIGRFVARPRSAPVDQG